MGAHFVLEIFENVDLAALVRGVEGAGAGHQRLRQPSACTTSTCASRWPGCWATKGRACRDELLDLATHRVAVPHAGQVESLNVAACAAVCFFEQLRQNQA